MSLVRPVFSITSHISGKTYDVIQTDADGGQSGQGQQVLQIATNDEAYFNAQIPNKFTEFLIDPSNPSQSYKEAITELTNAVQRGIEANVLDAAATEWSNSSQGTTSGLNLSSSRHNSGSNSGNSNSGNNQGGSRRQQQGRNLQVRQLVTN